MHLLHTVASTPCRLQEDLANLAQERIYSSDSQQFFLNLLLLLYAGADACDVALQQKVGISAATGETVSSLSAMSALSTAALLPAGWAGASSQVKGCADTQPRREAESSSSCPSGCKWRQIIHPQQHRYMTGSQLQ
jgi:hypothetical protein